MMGNCLCELFKVGRILSPMARSNLSLFTLLAPKKLTMLYHIIEEAFKLTI